MTIEERIQKMIEFQKRFNIESKKTNKDDDRSKEPLRFGGKIKEYVEPQNIDLSKIYVYAGRDWFAYDYPEEFSRWYCVFTENPTEVKNRDDYIKTSYDNFYKKLAIFEDE